MRLRNAHRVLAATAMGLAASVVVLVEASADDADTSRYPYDPACAWGRVANGKGMLLRCLTEKESRRLASVSPPPPGAAPPAPPPSSAPASPPTDRDGGASASPQNLRAEVTRVDAEVGRLPLAPRKLGLAADRFVECVTKNGGLNAARGEAQVRFLVRERGRAEGVSVAKRSGMSVAAAQCIADVIDRRFVGIPEEPIVGATAVVTVRPR
ncbi:MAG: hypothetical protein JW940_28870 [Polyangiaceae bacterium]|nr:hypothetical protein [Polyangiaceae bacterium]